MNEKKEVQWLRFDSLPSTNEFIKEKAKEGKDLVVLAKSQTGGKGTKGRSFSSEEGGVYLSLLRYHDGLPAKDAFRVMAGASAAVCRTLCSLGVKPVIKWPNDIYVNDKKICGILIENTFSGANIAFSVVGIGLNVNNVLPAELLPIATTVNTETGRTFSVEEIAKRLVEELYAPFSMDGYLSFVGYMGRSAELIVGDKRVHGRLVRVDETGGLIAETDGVETRYTSLEVSLRI